MKKISRPVETRSNDNEYPDYKRIIKKGSDGTSRSIVEVTYTDYVETYRTDPAVEVIKKPTPKIIEQGTRLRPTGFVTGVEKVQDEGWFGWNKGKFHIKGDYVASSEITLIVNDRVVDVTRVNDEGHFGFKYITVKNEDRIAIGTNDGRSWFWEPPKTTRVSEKYIFNDVDVSLLSEYDSIHDSVK
ncbi:MAG: G5 domain-containing protein [Candidatus Saccharibacteria bacterium]|nr:MAG: G5 domain-containing protein [Candidatus Saccharibacteria bacterium]